VRSCYNFTKKELKETWSIGAKFEPLVICASSKYGSACVEYYDNKSQYGAKFEPLVICASSNIVKKITILTSQTVDFCRLHAQALTLAALVGSACVEYYDNKYGSSGPKVDKYTSQYLAHSHKD
jgi:hypothetical protein